MFACLFVGWLVGRFIDFLNYTIVLSFQCLRMRGHTDGDMYMYECVVYYTCSDCSVSCFHYWQHQRTMDVCVQMSSNSLGAHVLVYFTFGVKILFACGLVLSVLDCAALSLSLPSLCLLISVCLPPSLSLLVCILLLLGFDQVCNILPNSNDN